VEAGDAASDSGGIQGRHRRLFRLDTAPGARPDASADPGAYSGTDPSSDASAHALTWADAYSTPSYRHANNATNINACANGQPTPETARRNSEA
jgi:hypothetical protein